MSDLDDWGIDGLIKKGGVMILNPKEDIVMIKSNELIKLVRDFNSMFESDLDDYTKTNIDLDKLLFNANCLTFELNKAVHNLKAV